MERPNIPEDLTNIDTPTLSAWRVRIDTCKSDIESQLSNMNRTIIDEDGRTRPMNATEYHQWRHRAVRAIAHCRQDSARIRLELGRRVAPRPANEKRAKDLIYPLLWRLCDALACDENVSIHVRDAADDLFNALDELLPEDQKAAVPSLPSLQE